MRRAAKNGMPSFRLKSPVVLDDPERSSTTTIRGTNPAADDDTQRTRLTPSRTAEDVQRLTEVIRQRINGRLAGRVRNLRVRFGSDGFVLEGECSTYYTKQLAQHAALGVLDDDHLENAIVVAVG
jgi:hypothetical protein